MRLWFLSEVPEAPAPVRAATRHHLFGEPLPTVGIEWDMHVYNQERLRRVLDDRQLNGMKVWDLATPFFRGNAGRAMFRDDRRLWYFDDNHINRFGARFLEAHLSDLLIEILRLEDVGQSDPS